MGDTKTINLLRKPNWNLLFIVHHYMNVFFNYYLKFQLIEQISNLLTVQNSKIIKLYYRLK